MSMNEEKKLGINETVEHTDSDECQCAKKRYVQIIDVDGYINSLNDWD